MLRCLVTSKSRLAQLTSIRYAVLNNGWRRGHRVILLRHSSSTPDHNNTTLERQNNAGRRGRSKAVHELAFLVSQQNVSSSSPEMQTPHDIKGYYRAVKAKGLLHELSAEELSSFIQLFGSLSLLPELEDQPSVYDLDGAESFALHPLAPALLERQTSGRRSHWAFVLAVAKDKISQGLSLAESDNYWLMRAAVEDVKRLSAEKSNDGDIRSCLERAREHYLLIKPPKDVWVVHQIYLATLLDYGGTKCCDEIIMRIGIIVNRKRGLLGSLRGILWRVVALPGANIKDSTKSFFLHILRKKLSEVPDMLPTSLRPENEVKSKVPANKDQSRNYDALAIRDYLVDILFAFNPRSHAPLRYLHEVYSWALFECRAALCAFNDGTFATSEEEDRAAWNNLVLLSLSFASARKSSISSVAPQQGLDGGVENQAQVLGWTVICALAAIASELRVRSPLQKRTEPAASHGIQEIARTLWILWRKEEAWRAGVVMRSTPLICSATTSFMSLACVSGDSRLAIALIRHIADSIIYPSQLGSEFLDRGVLQECAVHFAVLSATWGVGAPPHQSWDGILSSLHYAQLIPEDGGPLAVQLVNSIVNATTMHLARVDLMLAHSLVQSAAEHGLSMTGDTVLTIGKCLASEGHLELALSYLKDVRITTPAGALLLDTLLVEALHHRKGGLRLKLAQSFLGVFTDTSIRPTDNNALEAFIQACVRAGHLSESIRFVEIICESSSTLLRPAFLAQFVTALISHRYYKPLGKVLKDTWHRLPNRRASFFRGSRLHYTEELLTRFPKVTSREIARSLPYSVHVWPLLHHHIPFHPRLARLDKRIIALNLSSRLQNSGRLDEESLERAVHLLVNAGRITAALKLLSKHSPTISTKAGNIILSASLRPSRKSRRQVRHASTRLAQLVEERGFIPDRVTLNLLMKALLRWQSITPTSTVRALFDRLVMNGYPIPNSMSNALPNTPIPSTSGTPDSSTTPVSLTLFGTDASPSTRNKLPVNLRAFPKHISFAHHTRPLYKMFVKALDARGDKDGAERVANALRKVEENVLRERASRSEVRQLGRIRAREGARHRASSESGGIR